MPRLWGVGRGLTIGAVIDGKVIVDGPSLPEGAVVKIISGDSEATVHLSAAEDTELLEALDEADREEGISAEEMFDRLRKFCKIWPFVYESSRGPSGKSIEKAAE